MKSELANLVSSADSPLRARHLLREYLQIRILGSLHSAGAMDSLAFHGGTALRILFDLPRYSEDLDFALEQKQERYRFRSYLKQAQADLARDEYAVDLRYNDQSTVNRAMIRFPGLLYELGLSAHRSEVVSIRVEVDTNPPAGAGITTTPLTGHFDFVILHHDRSSLFSGKLHAILQRPYIKGRDIFDLWWYMTQAEWPEPNLVHLNHALVQTGWDRDPLTAQNLWRELVRRVQDLDWRQDIVQDVGAFILMLDWEEKFQQKQLVALLTQRT